jgi:putative ABC transport system permease protein
MLKNYLKIALRNIIKNKAYSIINISGLAIGMACFIFIALYIQYELGYDKFNENGDQIYRIILNPGNTAYQGKPGFNVTPAPLVPALKAECPEIVHASRVYKAFPEPLVQYGENSFVEKKFFYIDPDFLSMFTFPLLTGNPNTALNKPYSVLITREMANKYFGNKNPLGKSFTIDENGQYQVTGVIEDVPKNAHFTFDFLCSFSTLYSQRNNMDRWDNNNYQAYIQLLPGTSLADLETKFDIISKKYNGEKSGYIYRLEHLYQIHLYGDRNFEIEKNSDIQFLYLFGAIGFFILLIACFNYVNISTAQSVKRSKEVGLRKVIGANRIQLIRQFLVESLIISLLGFFLAILFVELLLPEFNSYMNIDIHFSLFTDMKMLFVLFGVLLVVGCLAGGYPAFFASAFQPAYILKSGIKGRFGSIRFRNVLVVVQFIICAILIIGTIIVYNQLQFIKNKDLGFEKDYIVTLHLTYNDKNMRKNINQFINELRLNPRVLNATASEYLPYEIRSSTVTDWDGKAKDNNFSIYLNRVDNNFLDLYGIPLIYGDKSSWDRFGSKSVFILNKTAQQALDWKNPVGKRFGCSFTSKENGIIAGVMEDFHYYPLHYAINPLVLELVDTKTEDLPFQYLSIKINARDVPGTISFIEKKWKLFSSYPFDFQFLDTQIDAMYKTEQRLGQLFNFFAILAIFIGCLGLYGLITFSIEQKIKEIGVRKVLGASISQIVYMLSKEIIICIVIANIVALPVSWYWMNEWLQDFAYRININWWAFVLSGGIALVIALATVSFQAVKAALTNPVDSLRYE